MSKLLKLPFALLMALAMLLLWSGVASAESEGVEPQPSGTGCDSIPLLPDCQPQRETTPETPAQPPHSVDEQLEASEAIPAFTGTPKALPAQEPQSAAAAEPGSEAGDEPGSEEESPAPGSQEPPDPAVVGACIQREITALLTVLQDSLEGTADQLAADIQAALAGNPLALVTFVEGLPARIQAVPELAEEFATELEAAVTGIVECLPEPPAPAEPPAQEQPKPAAKPATQPTAVHYANCDDARAKGAAPVYSGQPGYGSHLDSDNDGVGCEQETALVSHTPTAAPQLAYTGFEVEPILVAGAALLSLGTLTVIGAARRES